MFTSINPYTQSVVGEFSLHDHQAITQKLELAGKAFKLWRKESFSNRSKAMLKVAELLRLNKEQYAQIITMEMGKVISEARSEIEKCAVACEYFAQHSERLLTDTEITGDAKRSYISYEPLGALFGIMPWNFPFWQVFRFVVPTIMGGNVVLLKHAPNVCHVSLLIEDIFKQSGFPDGVFQSLIIDIDQVEGIVAHDIVQGVTLTGSEYAGSQVASLAGKYIKKSVLELGGSDAFIVLPDANLEKAAKVAIQSRMQNAGQSCIAAKRFIVVEEVKEEFLELLKKNVVALVQGNPLDEHVTTGPMARLDLAEKLTNQLKFSIQSGAQLIVGGERKGCNFIPAVIEGVTPTMIAFQEETFGPLAVVVTAQNEQEAINLANRSRYGLGSSIWTRDLDRAAVLAKDIDAGAVFVNSLVRSDSRWPFGGIKRSGYGRELGGPGIKEFMNAKVVLLEE